MIIMQTFAIQLKKSKGADLIKKSEFGNNLKALKNEIPNTKDY